MKVILLKNVKNLGQEGEVVPVQAGYGRNYLIPKGFARVATPGAVRARQDQLRQQIRKRAQERRNAELLRSELEKIVVKVEAKVGQDDRIFGSITAQQVALGLAVQGFKIDRRAINLEEDIRALGVYTVSIKLDRDVRAQVKVQVMPEGSMGF